MNKMQMRIDKKKSRRINICTCKLHSKAAPFIVGLNLLNFPAFCFFFLISFLARLFSDNHRKLDLHLSRDLFSNRIRGKTGNDLAVPGKKRADGIETL